MSLAYWAMCLNMLPPNLVWWVPGRAPHGIHSSPLFPSQARPQYTYNFKYLQAGTERSVAILVWDNHLRIFWTFCRWKSVSQIWVRPAGLAMSKQTKSFNKFLFIALKFTAQYWVNMWRRSKSIQTLLKIGENERQYPVVAVSLTGLICTWPAVFVDIGEWLISSRGRHRAKHEHHPQKCSLILYITRFIWNHFMTEVKSI